jgi:hypothetical protein
MSHFRQIFPSLLLCSLLAACGGSDSVGPGGDTGGDTRTIKATPAFAADIVEIFVRRGCTASSCHGGGAGSLTLTTNASSNHGQLVGVESPVSGEIRVIANDAANSYLVKKLEGTQGSGNGQRMPNNSSALDNTDLTNIKNWINTGALNN